MSAVTFKPLPRLVKVGMGLFKESRGASIEAVVVVAIGILEVEAGEGCEAGGAECR